jgi:hypothetical protein
MTQRRRKGFSYFVSDEQLKEYGSWPMERRLQWLLMGNRLRKMLPERTIEIQELFRQGKI